MFQIDRRKLVASLALTGAWTMAGRASAQPWVAVRQFSFCHDGVVNFAAVGCGRRCAVPDFPATGRAKCLPAERGMSWNDTASTVVELQSALHLLKIASCRCLLSVPLLTLCHACLFAALLIFRPTGT